MGLLSTLVLLNLGTAACASDDAAQTGATDVGDGTAAKSGGAKAALDAFADAPPPAPRISVRPLAVRRVPASQDGQNDSAATNVLRAAVSRTSGALVVDELSAKATLDNCKDIDNACESPLMNDFIRAKRIVFARADELGSVFFATGNTWHGTQVDRRVSAQEKTRLHAIAKVGWELGVHLRSVLEAEIAAAETENTD